MREPFYIGAQGNWSLHCVTASLNALAASGKQTLIQGVPIGTEITGIRHITGVLGADTAIKVELVNRSGSKELLTVTTTSAKSGTKLLARHYIGDDGSSDLVVTNTGTADATGNVEIQLEYRYIGY
ncbi:MAG: hypothetical protein HRU25_14835 [Psychrobium sp.]|nr:hypothetical protein [Psychrobium sp.]